MFRRYAHVRQEDPTDCGAAALAAVALHYRMPIGVQRLATWPGRIEAARICGDSSMQPSNLDSRPRPSGGLSKHSPKYRFPQLRMS